MASKASRLRISEPHLVTELAGHEWVFGSVCRDMVQEGGG
jgi:hypothetical protein